MAREGRWERAARRALPEMRRWRAALHRVPELSNEEAETRQSIVRALDALEVPTTTYEDGFHGVLGLLDGPRAGPVVALRADMDALPVTEETRLPFRSERPGKMHACGHDVHMASLLGAAAILRTETRFRRGPVKLLFQPAEEEGERGGALPFLERGCFDRPRVDFVVGQHVQPEIPLGTIGWRAGPLMAAADAFAIDIQGRGGHAAYPHRGPDAVVVASEIVSGLSALVSRSRNPLDPVVVSVGMIHGGTRHNILPDRVHLEGTVRTFRPSTRDLMERLIRQRVAHLAASLGARARVRYDRGYPVTSNDPAATQRVVEGLAKEFGPRALRELEEPVMGAEDFSRYLERVPGCFLFLGVGGRGVGTSLHSATFAPTDDALVYGAATLAAATEALQGDR